LTTINEFIAMIPSMPLNEQVLLRDQLDERIEESISMSQAALEQADIVLMEKRLGDYESGNVKGSPWEVVEARIRQSLGHEG
jgi:putative addiction module component (TIGR02574 family)